MKYEIKNLSQHKKEMQTGEMKVPAIFHASSDLLPNEDTLAEIEATAASGFVFDHFVAMSDVHSKKGRKNPAGTVVATEKYLLPQINDTAPNCGMRFLKTNLTDEDLKDGKMDKLFQELVEVVPTKAYVGTPVPYSLVMDICRFGVKPVTEFFGTKTKNEIQNTFNNGNLFGGRPERSEARLPDEQGSRNTREGFFADAQNDIPSEKDILNAIPKLFLHIGKYRLGILGAAGNHFLDLMKITEIKDENLAEKLGVKRGQYIFLMHTGSGLLGQYASYFYTPKEKEHFSQRVVLELGKLTFRTETKEIYKKLSQKINEYKNKKEFFAYDENSPEGKMFITAHRAAANQGFANRSILTHQIYQAVEKVLGKDPELDLLYDMPHVFVDKEKHLERDIWIHRNNASRAYGPSRMAGHPIFSETGEPAFIPSSMSTPAYIGVGTDENESSFFSAPHGTGRRKDPEKDIAKDKDQLFAKMEKKNVKLYNAKSKGVVLQDSSYYKDIEEVMEGIVDNKIVKIAAKMEPVAVLMY